MENDYKQGDTIYILLEDFVASTLMDEPQLRMRHACASLKETPWLHSGGDNKPDVGKQDHPMV